MKFTLAFIVAVLGMVICTTFPDLASSESDKHGVYDGNGLGEVLKQIVNLQQFYVDDSKQDLSSNDVEVAKTSGTTTISGSSTKGDRRGDVTTTSRRTDETAQIEFFTDIEKLHGQWYDKFGRRTIINFNKILEEFITLTHEVIATGVQKLVSKGVTIEAMDITRLQDRVDEILQKLRRDDSVSGFTRYLQMLPWELKKG